MVKITLTSTSSHVEFYSKPMTPSITDKCAQLDSDLLSLPPEVLEIILSFLDGLSLIRLSSTCAKLFIIVNQVAAWERHLLHDDIQFYHLIDLGINFGIPLWKIPPPRSAKDVNSLRALGYPWKQMYFSTQMWKSSLLWDFHLLCSSTVATDEISTVTVAGQDVIIGTLNGGVGLWNPDKNEMSLKCILQIPVEIDQILVQLTPDLHYRLLIHGIDTSLVIYDMAGFVISKSLSTRRNLERLSGHGENLFEWDPDTGSTAHLNVDENKRCSGYKVGRLPGSPFVAGDIHQHLLISQSFGPMLLSYDPLNTQNTWRRVQFLLDHPDNFYISRAYIWPEQITLSVTVGSKIIISVEDEVKIVKWPPTFKCVSAFLFAHVLIIGTNTGQILLYPFKDPTDLLKLDPNNYLQAISIGTCEAIIHIGVRVHNRVHHLPDIVAATRSQLFCFRANGFL